MRNSNTRCRTLKKRLSKSKKVFYAYSDLQYKYGDILELNEEIVEIQANVKLVGCELGDSFTTDFCCTKKDGSLMVRECVYKDKLLKPMIIKTLDVSRNYWAVKGVTDWGIVLDE